MNLTTEIRERVRTWMPLEDLLPDHLPAFVRSPAYFFGVISLSSLVLLILTGILLAAFGPQWWHDNAFGHFVNRDRKSTRLNSSHTVISYAVFCLKKKKTYSVP